MLVVVCCLLLCVVCCVSFVVCCVLFIAAVRCLFVVAIFGWLLCGDLCALVCVAC